MSLPNIGLPRSILSSAPLSILVPVATGTALGFFVNKRSDTKGTYKEITQPRFAPPPWVFGPVWTCLYAGMGYASYLAYVNNPLDTTGQSLYTAQLALNFLWTPLFFGAGKVGVALVDMLVMEAAILGLVSRWWGRGGELLVPYAGWTAFATYITVGVGALNGWNIGRKLRVKKE